jgi:glycosyltransferase involved in cell wall biosynthesis
MKKKLLFLVSHASFFISHRLQLAKAAKKNGYEVIIVFGEIDVDIKIIKEIDINYFCIPIQRGGTNFFQDLKSLYLIWSIFKKIKPDIVHLVTIKPYLYGGIIARIVKIPCVVSAISGMGSLFIQQNLISRILKLFLYPVYRLAFNHLNQKIIVQNKDDERELMKWGVLNPIKVKLLKGSGVNLEYFTSFDELTGTPVVCFAARLLRDKGVYDFVSAAQLLKERGVQAKFYLAGDLDINNPTGLNVDDLNKLKKNGYIKILGYQNDIPKLYANSHIICLPSYREGLPKSLVEAAAASRAIVTTDVPGCRDAIIPNKTGLLVPIKNPKKLADALQWLIEHPQERIAMGKEGRKFAEKEFSIEKIVQNHLDIYQDLLRNSSISIQ